MARLQQFILVLAAAAQIVQAGFLRELQANSDTKMSLKDTVTLQLVPNQVAGKTYFYSSFLIGANQADSKKGAITKLIPDLSTNGIMIGSYKDLDWGINCEDASMGCSKIDGSDHTCNYQNSSATCQNVTTYIRFKNDSLLPSQMKRMTMELLKTSDKWEMKNHGVFGLGPKSTVWEYLSENYGTNKNTIDFSLFYRANKIDHMIDTKDENFKNAIFVVNGKGIAIDPFFVNYPKTSSTDSWILSTVNFSRPGLSGKTSETNEKVCLANAINATIASSSYSELVQTINFQLCGNKDGGCVMSNSQISNVTKWKFMLYNDSDKDSKFEIEVKPEEFINFNAEGKAVVLIDDLANYGNLCKGATMAFGKFFMTSREIVIRYNKQTKNFMIGFHAYEPTLIFLIILLSLASIIFAAFLIICIYSLVVRARKHFSNTDEAGEQVMDNNDLVKSADIN